MRLVKDYGTNINTVICLDPRIYYSHEQIFSIFVYDTSIWTNAYGYQRGNDYFRDTSFFYKHIEILCAHMLRYLEGKKQKHTV